MTLKFPIKLPEQKLIRRTVLEFMEVFTACVAIVFTDATSKSIILGGIIALTGASLFTWAGGFQRKERRGGLTLGGPYRFVRHPWILSRFLMVFGIILMARLPWLFLLAMLGLAPVYRKLTREEDEWLNDQLGPMAAEYRAFVAGFIPQFLPAKLPSSGKSVDVSGFSWRRALWKRPGRGGFAFLGVGISILASVIWLEHLLPVYLWRLLTVIVSAMVLWRLSEDRKQNSLKRSAPGHV